VKELQDNNFGCLGYVASYITGEPFSSVVEFVGHDASVRGFTEEEIIPYLLSRGFYYGSDLSFITWRKDEGKPRAASERFHVSDLMINISRILGAEENQHLREDFDNFIEWFIAKHEPEYPAEVKFTDVASGVDGELLQKKAIKIGQITANIPIWQPAIVSVVVDHDKHALFWSGKDLWDPHFPHPVCLSKYEVLEWKPVRKIDNEK
jgi:hypothetical protein